MIHAFVDRVQTLESGERVAVLIVRWREGDYFEWLVPLEWLPPSTREGHWLVVSFETDPRTQARMHQQVEQLLKELKTDDGV